MKMNFNKISEKVIYLSNKINQKNKKPNNYGTSHALYTSEIHMIEAISKHKSFNASELANIMGITNGAINQVANKLIKKGLVEPYRINDNKKDVYYQLTDKGKIANSAHKNYHKKQYSYMEEYIEGLSTEEIKTINHFLDELIDSWPPK